MQNRTDYISPPLELVHLTMGYSVQMADSFWLRAIQDIDFCDKPLTERECKGKSWLFNVINMTVELDKRFREAYYFGGLSLTVIISDYAGASTIFDKGVDQFGKDWPLLYAAGYHALFEEKNKLKASDLFLRAANNGAPSWLRLSAGRLATEAGDTDFARKALAQMIANESDPVWVEKLKKKLEQIQR